MKVCNILQIDAYENEKLESLMNKLEIFSKTPYFTSTQKEILLITREIIEAISTKININKINGKIKKLNDKVLFDRYFD